MVALPRFSWHTGCLLAAALLAACSSPDSSRTTASSPGAATAPFTPASGPTADPAATSPGADPTAATASEPGGSTAPPVATPADSLQYLLSPGRVGSLRLNMRESELLKVVPAKQMRASTRTLEGIRYPVYELPDHRNPQAPPLLLEMVGDSVEGYRLWRVRVTDPKYRTAAGIGVGSPYGAARQLYPVSTVERTDAGLVAVSDQVGMSWLLDEKSLPKASRTRAFTPGDIPPATRITEVLLFR